MLELLQGSPAAAIATAGVIGLIVGSFLNVVILRLPVMMEYRWRREAAEILGDSTTDADAAPPGLVAERSCCPKCSAQIRAYDNIPVVSYLLLRGRCRACGNRISLQYPLVELATAVATALCIWRFGMTLEGYAAVGMTWCLIALTGIDVRTQLLPDGLTLPLLWAGLLLSLAPIQVSPSQAIVGAAAGYLSLWSVYWLFKLTTGKEGMGYGDFKLLAAIGAWLGWQILPLTILLSSVVGAVVGIALIVFRRHGRETPIPFGPYLAAAGLLSLYWGTSLTRAYLGIL